MGFFKRANHGSQFYTEDPAEERFDAMMDLVKDLSRRDYNRIKEAMDLGYNAYQKVRNIDADDTPKANDMGYMVPDEEGK
ncbi:MAG: hypothetical protein K6G49_02150 [Candidatus Saccharibacteria bacterium]|nr:hypothetical protein [Candidatus Saccharibacteria bacterium]